MAINIHKIFADALLKLCETKRLESITIKDLLEETGVSRQAFYNRFMDKNDLILWTYTHNVLNKFLENGPDSSYYNDTLNYYRALDSNRSFMKQAIQMKGQNNLRDEIFKFAIDYDVRWHKRFYGHNDLPKEFLYASWYHSVASITAAMDWLESDNPDSPEVMATRITSLRKISLSDTYFGPDADIYAVPEDIEEWLHK